MVRKVKVPLTILMIFSWLICHQELGGQEKIPNLHRYQVDYRYRGASGQTGHLKFNIVIRPKDKGKTQLWVGMSAPEKNKVEGKKDTKINIGNFDKTNITIIRNDRFNFENMFISFRERDYWTKNFHHFVKEVDEDIPTSIYIINDIFRLFVYSFPQKKSSSVFHVPVRVTDKRNNSELPHQFFKLTQPNGERVYQNEYLIRRNWPSSTSVTFISQTLKRPNYDLSFFDHQIIELNRNIYSKTKGQKNPILQNSIRAELRKIDR